MTSLRSALRNTPLRRLYHRYLAYKNHFFTPYYYRAEVRSAQLRGREAELFTIKSRTLPGIDLREADQLAFLNELRPLYASVPFTDGPQPGYRYHFDNPFYSYSDAIFLHLLLRHQRPRRVIEIGSGWSSAVMLDTNQHFLNDAVELTFIEPYPQRLYSLLSEADRQRHRFIISDLQAVPLEEFDRLQPGDFLFVDSTHVSKTGSDVNYILFDLLPRLPSGVWIHVHDIFYPFEYPRKWVMDSISFGWNEDYALRAFLMYNDRFRIRLFNTFLEHFNRPWFEQHMPLCLKNPGGSIWIEKV
jgi:hypothetical protein